MQFDLLDAFPEFPDLRLLRIVKERVLGGSVVQVDLAEERTLGVMEVAALGLDVPPGLAGIFFLPFGDNVVVGLDFEQAFEDERETLGGRLFERQDFDVVVVHAQMAAVAFEVRFAKVVVEKRVVHELRDFELVGVKVEGLLEDTERFLLSENAYGQKVADLQRKASRLLKESGLGLPDFVAQDEDLFFRKEASGQFRKRLPGIQWKLRKCASEGV